MLFYSNLHPILNLNILNTLHASTDNVFNFNPVYILISVYKVTTEVRMSKNILLAITAVLPSTLEQKKTI